MNLIWWSHLLVKLCAHTVSLPPFNNFTYTALSMDHVYHHYITVILTTFTDNVLKTTLALYMEGIHSGQSFSVPTYEEVLVCSERTTDEEVTMLWMRAIRDHGHFRLFCLVHAERLSYQVCDKALQSLTMLSQGKQGQRSSGY